MRPTTSPRYADWKAPAEDGRVLLWPESDEIARDAERNLDRLNSGRITLSRGISLGEVRREMRRWVGHENNEQPLVAMGHQTELYHAGVWAKNALIDAAAAKVGGRAVQFAVDTDEPKHLKLKWPGGVEAITDDQSAAEWTGLLAAPSPAHLARVGGEFENAAASWEFEPRVPAFLASLRRLAIETPTLPVALTNAMHELDWSLGLRQAAMLFSPLCASEPYLLFAHHVLARADAFAAHYNAALEDFRREHRVRTPGRPMPNLKAEAESCEVPYWLDSLADGTRKRGFVARRGDVWVLRTPDGADEFAFHSHAGARAASQLGTWLRQHGLRLSPRALMLTTFLRLLVVDQFVHGIGGGRYDQVADRLIARHFGIEPPRFAVTTATLYFPAAVGRQRVCMSCLVQEGHRLRHRVLGREKDRLVAAIAAAPRGSLERSSMYHEMHNRLAAAAGDPSVRRWEERLEEAGRREAEEKDLFDRELFYAIQPADRLQNVIQYYREQFAP